MKIIASILVLLLVSSAGSGQKNSVSQKDSPEAIFDCLYVNIDEKPAVEERKLPYKEIVVVDERPDTSKCGFWYSKKYRDGVKLCVNRGFQQNVSSFINSYFKNDLSKQGNSVLLCIKKCWTNNYEISFPEIELKFELYIKTDSCYYPLYRFNDKYTDSQNEFPEPGEFIARAIVAGMQKLYLPQFASNNRRCLSFAEIDSFNQEYKRLPVLTNKVAKGVYLDFKQFKNNQPAYRDFELSLGEFADVIFVKGKNIKDSSIMDAWAFSDGQDIFVRMANNFFPLFRCGNTFDLYGFTKITEHRFFQGTPVPYHGYTPLSAIDLGVQALFGMIKSKSKDLRPYQINMDNGEYY